MNRIIKFKIWDKKNKNWINWFELEQPLHFYCRDSNNHLFEVCEFTGLKDLNGKDIYNGDILEFEFYEIAFEKNTIPVDKKIVKRGIVEWDQNYCLFTINGYGLWKETLEQYNYKIIGNIIESPELLDN